MDGAPAAVTWLCTPLLSPARFTSPTSPSCLAAGCGGVRLNETRASPPRPGFSLFAQHRGLRGPEGDFWLCLLFHGNWRPAGTQESQAVPGTAQTPGKSM